MEATQILHGQIPFKTIFDFQESPNEEAVINRGGHIIL